MALAIGLLVGILVALLIIATMEDKESSELLEQKKTNELLEKLIKECKRNSDLVEAYNRKYHV